MHYKRTVADIGRFRLALERHGLEPPPGVVEDARWIAGRDDWYAKVDGVWLWWSGKQWKECPLGPLE